MGYHLGFVLKGIRDLFRQLMGHAWRPGKEYKFLYLFDDYIHDMRIVQAFAALNRQAIMDEILRGMKLHTID